MDEFEKKEFWDGLPRLYNASVKTQEAAETLRLVSESHERRLDRAEVLLDALRDEVNRLKRERPPQ